MLTTAQNKLKASIGFSVSAAEFSNEDGSSKVLDPYGAELDASRIKYLTPQITFDTLDTFPGSKELFVKVIKPDGSLLTGSSSPAGYSYKYTLNAQTGKKGEKLKISGWGSESGGVYTGGTYTFEIWSENFKLYSRQFTVHAFAITNVEFSNTENDGRLIGSYGTEFRTEQLKYLTPRITYDNTGSYKGVKDLFVKIIKPDGSVERASSSPSGYTYKDSLNVQSGKKGEKVSLTGWGNSKGGSYSGGTHTFEIWCEGKKLYGAKFNIKAPQVLICSACAGLGQGFCMNCAGTGKVWTYFGPSMCFSCVGTGRLRCGVCGGSGKVTY
jgi:hypothetical protein